MDGALLTTADTLRARAAGAIARSSSGDRARGAALRAGLFHPGVWSVFQRLGPAGQAGALAALAFCQEAEEVEDAIQAAALLSIDPVRQAAAARAARDRQLPEFHLDDAEARARNGRSRARREHMARPRGGVDLVRAEHARRRDGIQDHLARALGGADGDPHPHADFGTGPLELLLREEAEALDGCDDLLAPGALAVLNPPRPRGRPTRAEVLERAGQQQLPGLAPGGSTTRSATPPPARAPAMPPEQPTLF